VTFMTSPFTRPTSTVRSPVHSAIKLLAVVAVSLGCTLAAHAQQNFDNVQIRSEKLSNNVYMLVGRGGNMGLSVGPDTTLLIDTQFAPLTARIDEAVKALAQKPLAIVVNSHFHSDHTGGNVNMGKAGITIVAHENVRRRLESPQFIEFMRRTDPAMSKEGLPSVTFKQDMTFHINGEELYVIHVPRAHTDGDAIAHFKGSNVLHMGDLYFNGFYPFIDYSSGGTPDGLIAAIDRAIAIADDKTKIIPGHGPLATKADMIQYRAMLAGTIGKIKELVKQGKTLEQAVEAKPTAEFDERWGKGFIPPARYVEMIMKGLGAIPVSAAPAPPAPPAPTPAPAAR
jgi:cyclase